MAKKKQHGGARPGAGRKPLGKRAMADFVRVPVDVADKKRWRAAARARKQSLSDYVRVAVEQRIERDS